MENKKEEWPRNYPVSDKSILEISIEFLTEIEKRQAENFVKAGKIMGDNMIEGGLVKLVGTGGHTYMPVFDMSHRAGAFVTVNPTFDVSSSPINGGTRSIRIERVEGYFRALMDYFHVKKDDVVIIFNNIGVNAGTIDSALECKRRGAIVIGVGSSIWQEDIPMDHYTRHSSKKNLMEIVDLFIDDYNPMGDTVIKIEGFDRTICPISSITEAYIVRRLEEETVRYMLSKGVKPKIWVSANCVGGDESNAEYEEEYWYKVKML
jgi:uncharacterized phosphosugar-binding protein